VHIVKKKKKKKQKIIIIEKGHDFEKKMKIKLKKEQ